MTILCIETSTSVCSAAICKDGVPVAQLISREGANHAKLLPGYIEQLLDMPTGYRRDTDEIPTTARSTIEAVALSAGPGSYTGLRIGTSTAKGLCYGLNVPLIAVPTLQLLCEAALQHPRMQETGPDVLLCPMIDARRMEVYTALFDRQPAAQSDVQAVVVDEMFQPANRFVYFGDGAAKCQAVLKNPEYLYLPDIVPEAQYMGRLAEQMAQAGKLLNANEIAYYEPFYLKEFVAAQSHVKGLV
ncbi:MAG: tRNA (adenosine(37)-N6)-threonylcarbamoyltransferase complex dimerization subunit type 1 TsaB [Paludibacteraceae bacterium]|nr:tRNA (adenosine(37)-N6)-threonylcarbamoyltransferase complex dimerization subunit type 1 TsaB [Paludibacteraceae bacterium]